MSQPPLNPYEPPRTPAKMTDAEAADVKHRDLAMFVLLNVVTCGIYWFYVSYHWAKELNGLQGRPKYHPGIVLLVNIVSCGLAGLVFECLYAFDIAEVTRLRGIVDRKEQLGTWVIALNCIAIVLSLIPFAAVIGFPLGLLASALMQVELNKLADQYRFPQ